LSGELFSVKKYHQMVIQKNGILIKGIIQE